MNMQSTFFLEQLSRGVGGKKREGRSGGASSGKRERSRLGLGIGLRGSLKY